LILNSVCRALWHLSLFINFSDLFSPLNTKTAYSISTKKHSTSPHFSCVNVRVYNAFGVEFLVTLPFTVQHVNTMYLF